MGVDFGQRSWVQGVLRLLAAAWAAVQNIVHEDVAVRAKVARAHRAAIAPQGTDALARRGARLRGLFLEGHRTRVARRAARR